MGAVNNLHKSIENLLAARVSADWASQASAPTKSMVNNFFQSALILVGLLGLAKDEL